MYVEHRHGRPDELGLITSETWREYNETKTLQLSEEHAANLVSYPFIAMPMNIRDNHWVLAILAYVNPSVLGDAQGTPNTCTSVLVFDSLGSGSKALRKPLEAFVGLLLSRSGLTEDTDPVIVFAAPKVNESEFLLSDLALSLPCS